MTNDELFAELRRQLEVQIGNGAVDSGAADDLRNIVSIFTNVAGGIDNPKSQVDKDDDRALLARLMERMGQHTKGANYPGGKQRPQGTRAAKALKRIEDQKAALMQKAMRPGKSQEEWDSIINQYRELGHRSTDFHNA
jgi:hypothetical protein